MMSRVIEPTREAALRRLIAQRAYEIWENQGQPHGCDLIHWHEAEQEIMECVKQAAEASKTPEVLKGPARAEQQFVVERQDELQEEETRGRASESRDDAVVRVSRSFFALVVQAD